MEIMQGVCDYCGQVQNVRALDQIHADQLASENCNCPESKVARKKEQVFKDIDEISKATAYAPELDLNIVHLIKTAAEQVINSSIESATFKSFGTTVTVKETSSNIKVTRRDVISSEKKS